MNDLPSVLRGVIYIFYADYAQVYGHFSLAMQQNAQAVSNWATHNGPHNP